MANNDMDRVVPLGQLDDFKVAEGDPDVRGWEVLASDGRKIGEVDELLVDTNAMKVRYLDVDVDGGVMGDGMDRHVLIPIGYARLEQEADRVLVEGLASSDLAGLPSYNQGPLTRDFESSVRDSFSSRGTSTGTAGMTGAGAGMMDTAGLDNTPGTGTAMGMGAAGAGLAGAGMGMRDDDRTIGRNVPEGEGMRAAGYDTGQPTHSPLRGTHTDTGSLSAGAARTDADLRDTGSMRTGTDSDLGVRAGGTLHGGGMVAPTEGSTEGRAMSAGSASHGSPMGGGTFGGSGNAPMAAGGQGPVGGMGTPLAPHGDVSHQSSGLAGSDYQHNADEDFYASDAFDDNRFYGARRGGGGLGGDVASGRIGGGMGTGGLAGGSDTGMHAGGQTGTPGGGAATREEVDRLAKDASELLREDHRNRGVGGQGNL